MKTALILAAGLGSRLRPLTDRTSKALVPLGDRPLIEHALGHLRRFGWERVGVNVFHQADALEHWARTAEVIVSREHELLGTAGGVAQARRRLGDADLLVFNVDILARPDLDAFCQNPSGAEAVLAVQPRPRGEGNVGVDARGRIVRLRSAAVADERSGGNFMGIHMLSARLASELPARGCLVGDVYIPSLQRGAHLAAFDCADFVDVGTPVAYLEANLAWVDRRGGSWVHATATTDPRVSLHRSLIGAGAQVCGFGDLTECVVWPGACATAPLARAVVTPWATLTVPTSDAFAATNLVDPRRP